MRIFFLYLALWKMFTSESIHIDIYDIYIYDIYICDIYDIYITHTYISNRKSQGICLGLDFGEDLMKNLELNKQELIKVKTHFSHFWK